MSFCPSARENAKADGCPLEDTCATVVAFENACVHTRIAAADEDVGANQA